MASIADMIAASTDTDLRARVRAAADARGLPLNWTDLHMGRLVATEIQSGGDQTTIANVYGYALATYTPTPRPGENPAAVLDSMIFDAIGTIDAGTV